MPFREKLVGYLGKKKKKDRNVYFKHLTTLYNVDCLLNRFMNHTFIPNPINFTLSWRTSFCLIPLWFLSHYGLLKLLRKATAELSPTWPCFFCCSFFFALKLPGVPSYTLYVLGPGSVSALKIAFIYFMVNEHFSPFLAYACCLCVLCKPWPSYPCHGLVSLVNWRRGQNVQWSADDWHWMSALIIVPSLGNRSMKTAVGWWTLPFWYTAVFVERNRLSSVGDVAL